MRVPTSPPSAHATYSSIAPRNAWAAAATQASAQSAGRSAAAAAGRDATTAFTTSNAASLVAASLNRAARAGDGARHHQASSVVSSARVTAWHAAVPIAPSCRRYEAASAANVAGTVGNSRAACSAARVMVRRAAVLPKLSPWAANAAARLRASPPGALLKGSASIAARSWGVRGSSRSWARLSPPFFATAASAWTQLASASMARSSLAVAAVAESATSALVTSCAARDASAATRQHGAAPSVEVAAAHNASASAAVPSSSTLRAASAARAPEKGPLGPRNACAASFAVVPPLAKASTNACAASAAPGPPSPARRASASRAAGASASPGRASSSVAVVMRAARTRAAAFAATADAPASPHSAAAAATTERGAASHRTARGVSGSAPACATAPTLPGGTRPPTTPSQPPTHTKSSARVGAWSWPRTSLSATAPFNEVTVKVASAGNASFAAARDTSSSRAGAQTAWFASSKVNAALSVHTATFAPKGTRLKSPVAVSFVKATIWSRGAGHRGKTRRASSKSRFNAAPSTREAMASRSTANAP